MHDTVFEVAFTLRHKTKLLVKTDQIVLRANPNRIVRKQLFTLRDRKGHELLTNFFARVDRLD